MKALKFAKASQQSSFLEIVFDFASLPGFLLAGIGSEKKKTKKKGK